MYAILELLGQSGDMYTVTIFRYVGKNTRLIELPRVKSRFDPFSPFFYINITLDVINVQR